VAAPSNTTAGISYEWSFGDGSPINTNRHAAHNYNTAGTFGWSLTVRAGSATAAASGEIVIESALRLGMVKQSGGALLAWPRSSADAVLEHTLSVGGSALWTATTNSISTTPNTFEALLPTLRPSEFLRLRQVK
jgi:PKD repeat protein